MLFQQLSLIASLAAVGLASPIEHEKRQQKCTTGAVVFAVRGSDQYQENLGYNPRYADLPSGMTGAAQAVINKYGGNSYLSAIQYPAIDPASGQYGESVNKGILALQGAIMDYVKACSTGDIYVMGYSQGGQVMSGALAGSNVAGPVDAHQRIKAGVIYADPTYRDGIFPLDAGSGANNGPGGTVPGDGSKQRALNERFGSRVRSYCQAGDKYCDSGNGNDAGAIHGNCPEYFQKDATNWLVNMK